MLKTNYIGILGAVIAFISLVLPWWTLTMSFSVAIPAGTISTSSEANFYLYQLQNSVSGFSLANTWYYNWIALALVFIGAIVAVAGSVMERGRALLAVSGVLEIIAMIVFAIGLNMDLPNSGYARLGLFSSGTTFYILLPTNFSTYLSYGFWLAIVAAIVMFAASAWRPREAAAPQPPAPPSTS